MNALKEELRKAYQADRKSGRSRSLQPVTDRQSKARKVGKWKGRLILWMVASLLVGFFFWARQAEIDSMVRGSGKAIPNSSNQVIQSLEGGIVEELSVREGDLIKEGQVLLRLQDEQFSAIHEANMEARDAIEARMIRLKSEAEGVSKLSFPPDLSKRQPNLVETESKLFKSRIADQKTRIKFSSDRLNKEKEKYDVLKGAFERGSLPKVDQIELEAKIVDLEEKLETIKTAFVRQAWEEYDDERDKLATLLAEMKGAADKVKRTEITSPIDGVVNKIHIQTSGRVISPGEPIMEIVPEGDSLLIEAKIRPADIAFLHKDQSVLVNFTAYDFSIYGGLKGKIETIGVDTIYDEQSRETFYPVKVRTLEDNLGRDKKTGELLELVPGMVAEVSIITGKKTVLEYILKPINRAKAHALREQ